MSVVVDRSEPRGRCIDELDDERDQGLDMFSIPGGESPASLARAGSFVSEGRASTHSMAGDRAHAAESRTAAIEGDAATHRRRSNNDARGVTASRHTTGGASRTPVVSTLLALRGVLPLSFALSR